MDFVMPGSCPGVKRLNTGGGGREVGRITRCKDKPVRQQSERVSCVVLSEDGGN